MKEEIFHVVRGDSGSGENETFIIPSGRSG
jgi:hypothetical protein